MDAFLSFFDAGPRLYFSFLTLPTTSSLTIPKLPGHGAFSRVVISRPAFQQDRVRYEDRAGYLACEFAHWEGLLKPLSISFPHVVQAGLALDKKPFLA